MRTELISIATDTLPLDGAFYLPDAEPSGAVMLFHGNTMNFYVGAPRFLPPVLTRLGFACLAFNWLGFRTRRNRRWNRHLCRTKPERDTYVKNLPSQLTAAALHP